MLFTFRNISFTKFVYKVRSRSDVYAIAFLDILTFKIIKCLALKNGWTDALVPMG